MKCPKCGNTDSKQFKQWYGGGRQKAQCLECYWHGLADRLYNNIFQSLGK